MTLVKLKISHGEYQFESFFITTNENIDDVAKYYYSDEGGEAKDGGYYFDEGRLFVEVAWARTDVSEAQFKVLQELGIM